MFLPEATLSNSQESLFIELFSCCLAACQRFASRCFSLKSIPYKADPLLHFQLQSYVILIKKYPRSSSASVCQSTSNCSLQTKMPVVCKLQPELLQVSYKQLNCKVCELQRTKKKGTAIGTHTLTEQLIVFERFFMEMK